MCLTVYLFRSDVYIYSLRRGGGEGGNFAPMGLVSAATEAKEATLRMRAVRLCDTSAAKSAATRDSPTAPPIAASSAAAEVS